MSTKREAANIETYVVGDLVWSLMNPWPFWPSIVLNSPHAKSKDTKEKVFGDPPPIAKKPAPLKLKVVFINDNARTADISQKNLVMLTANTMENALDQFKSLQKSSAYLNKPANKATWKEAVRQAITIYRPMHRDNRINSLYNISKKSTKVNVTITEVTSKSESKKRKRTDSEERVSKKFKDKIPIEKEAEEVSEPIEDVPRRDTPKRTSPKKIGEPAKDVPRREKPIPEPKRMETSSYEEEQMLAEERIEPSKFEDKLEIKTKVMSNKSEEEEDVEPTTTNMFEKAKGSVAPEGLPEITDDMKREIISHLEGKDDDDLEKSYVAADVTCGDLHDVFVAEQHLTTNDVDHYMEMLQQSRPSVKTVGYAFYTSLKRTLSEVKDWIDNLELFEARYLVIPCYEYTDERKGELFDEYGSGHYSIFIIDFDEQNVTYYDSLRRDDNMKIFEKMKTLIRHRSRQKKDRLNLDEWQFNLVSTPVQKNEVDCGVYTCVYAEYKTAGRAVPDNWSDENILYFRHKMAYEILRNRIL